MTDMTRTNENRPTASNLNGGLAVMASVAMGGLVIGWFLLSVAAELCPHRG
jgi:hypothetical protein